MISEDINQLERFLEVGARVILHTFWTVIFVGAVFAATSSAADPPRLPARADHRLGFHPVPAGAGAAVQGGARSRREVSATVSGNLGGLTTIKAFTAEQREVDRVSG